MKPNLQETLRRQAQELLELARDEYADENQASVSTHTNSPIGSVHWFRHLLAPTIHYLEFLVGDAPNGKLASPAVAESCLRKLEELRENYNKIFFFPDSDGRARIFNEICAERLHQDVQHGVQNHAPAAWSLILGEEVGEVNRAALESHFNGASLDNYRAELIQVAAVAVSMIECLENKNNKKKKGMTFSITNQLRKQFLDSAARMCGAEYTNGYLEALAHVEAAEKSATLHLISDNFEDDSVCVVGTQFEAESTRKKPKTA